MLFLKKILVTTDLSVHSLEALEYAVSLGSLYGSRIYLLHVIEAKGTHRKPEEEAKAAFEEFVRAHVHASSPLQVVTRKGIPADEIIRFAGNEGMDLVVIATHGRTGLQHIWMGSVAERVVRHSTVPVLTVKPRPIRENLLGFDDVEKELHLR
jgi:nucleotide-binding universal stress UspA family protein